MNEHRASLTFLWIAAIAFAVLLSAANLHFGELNQDEGWYLNSARLVAEGQLPYLDFAFTQAPVMPMAYAVFSPIIEKHGLAAGRIITALIGLAAAGLAAALAARLSPQRLRKGAACAAFILTGVNVYQSYFFTVVKTYSLSAVFLLAGFLSLIEGYRRRRNAFIFAAGVLAVYAAGTRASAGIVSLAMFLGLLASSFPAGPGRNETPRFAWLFFVLGAVCAAGVVFLPFLIMAGESFIYFVFKYHALRHSGSLESALLHKAGFLSRVLQAYSAAFFAGTVVALAKLARAREYKPGKEHFAPRGNLAVPERILWASAIALTLVHFSAPFPYDDYQAMVFPLFAAAIAVAAVRLAGEARMVWMLSGLLIVSAGASVSSPINQEWFIQGRDRIWWINREKTPLKKLRETAEMIKKEAGAGSIILTQDPYLAVETGLKVPPGMEMGQFCYFPDFSDDTASKLHVLNRNGFERLLKTTPASLAALSGYAFAIKSPEIAPVSPEEKGVFEQLLESRYETVTNVSGFGQAGTTLRIYRKKNP